jgi:hypothetical protein
MRSSSCSRRRARFGGDLPVEQDRRRGRVAARHALGARHGEIGAAKDVLRQLG